MQCRKINIEFTFSDIIYTVQRKDPLSSGLVLVHHAFSMCFTNTPRRPMYKHTVHGCSMELLAVIGSSVRLNLVSESSVPHNLMHADCSVKELRIKGVMSPPTQEVSSPCLTLQEVGMMSLPLQETVTHTL